MTVLIFASILLLPMAAFAQPEPGDVFREYTWYNRGGDAGSALRVGGNVDYGGYNKRHWGDLDLEHAVKAEVVIEKILSHDSTRGLAIQINDNEWFEIPEAAGITSPQHMFNHHIYPSVEVPLTMLKTGNENVFRMKVSTVHNWGWPQNLINGVHFRIYYDAEKKPHPTGVMTSPAKGERIGDMVTVGAEGQSPNGAITKIEYVGLYTDVNFEGDGVYYQWHYHYFHGKVMNHIGTSSVAPFEVEWDTSWVPDQDEPIKIAARIHDDAGMIYMTDAVEELELARDTISVELARPYNIPSAWVTRKSGKRENIDIAGDPSKIIAVQLAWSSWSPGYMNGIYINYKKVFDKEGPLYKSYAHRVTIDSLDVFLKGENIISTGTTSAVNGKTVHGMEVNWPGIMVLLRYDSTIQTSVDENQLDEKPMTIEDFTTYPNPFNASTSIHYTLTEQAQLRCTIMSLAGQKVRTIADSFQEAGSRTYQWDGRNSAGESVASGIYIALLEADSQRAVRKLMYMK